MSLLLERDHFHYGEEIKISFSFVPCDYIGLHTHEFYEIAYVSNGEGWHIYNGKKESVHSGDYVILDLNAEHAFTAAPGPEMHVTNCIFKPEFIDRSLAGCQNLSQVLETYLLPGVSDPNAQLTSGMILHDKDGRVLQLIDRIRHELERRESGYNHLARLYLVELLIFSMRSVDQSRPRPKHYPDDIRRVYTYINEHYTEKITLAFCAELAGLSSGALCQKFKAVTGMGITQYIQSKRISLACRLLVSSGYHIPDIARTCGYTDTKYFTEVFKRLISSSPSAYRRAKRLDKQTASPPAAS